MRHEAVHRLIAELAHSEVRALSFNIANLKTPADTRLGASHIFHEGANDPQSHQVGDDDFRGIGSRGSVYSQQLLIETGKPLHAGFDRCPQVGITKDVSNSVLQAIEQTLVRLTVRHILRLEFFT